LSKQFTAAAVALLILNHKIALSDPVAKYLPEVSKYGNGLLVEHLIYMTSGLHEYTDEPRKNGAPWMTFYYFTRDEAIAAALQPDQLEFTPGTEWAYRNINYMLLTKIVEVVSQKPFAAFMQDRVFRPLGMAHSEVNDDSTKTIPHRATGYALRSDPRVIKELAQTAVAIKPGDGCKDSAAAEVRSDTDQPHPRFDLHGPVSGTTLHYHLSFEHATWRCRK
jgi:CubicO group peptidase (beta-lactamase class C family)